LAANHLMPSCALVSTLWLDEVLLSLLVVLLLLMGSFFLQ
jgi:hypothetical protein